MKNSKNVNMLFLGGNYLRLSLILFICIISQTVSAQKKMISGKVVDNTGVPLPGANVVIKGNSKGASTDFDGTFSIEAEPTSYLVISYVGMDNTTVLVGNKTNLSVKLQSSAQSLQEVVVSVGYGVKKRSDVISSVASVKASDLLRVATSDVGEMLRGKAAGVQVTLNNGKPGSSSNILIRGKKTITGSSTPLVLADGIVIGDINDINANDIASMEILKDAAAQSMYGSRAANGVILITTKKGKIGKARISYNGFSGIQTINRNFDIYSGDEFAQLKREAARTSNGGVYKTDAQVFTALELESVTTGKYIDWEKYLLKTGNTNNHNISVSSGTETSSIFSSLNYTNINGVIPNSNYEKVSLRLNFDQKINDWLKIGMNTSFQYSESNDPNDGGILLNSITTSPLGRVYNDDGSLRYLPGGVQETPNPLIDVYETNTNELNRNDILNLYFDVTPFKGFSYKMNVSRRSWNYKGRTYNTTKSLAGIGASGQGSGNIYFQDNVEYQVSNILNYRMNVAEKNHFSVTAVQESLQSEYNNFKDVATKIPNDILGIYGLPSAFLNTPTITGNQKQMISFAGKLEYDFDNKYYFSASGRADGSSVFGANNKWGYFPALNAAWNIAKEDFMSNHVPVLNVLKLRGSYGSIGNQPKDPYTSIATANSRDYNFDGTRVSGYVPGSQLSNPDLKWETSTQLNLAVDFGLFKNRISGTVEAYNTDTKNLLVQQAITGGYSSILSNIGKVNNRGLEASLNTEIVKSKDFKLNLGLSFTKNINKIVSIYGKDTNGDGVEDDDTANKWFIGKPIDVYWQWKAVGIYQVGETIPADAGTGLIPGDIKLYNANPADGAKPGDADKIISSKMPDWYGTASLNMQYKNFDLTADIYTVQGVTKENLFAYNYNEGGSLRGIKNGLKQDYWTPENPTGTWPRPREGNDPPYMSSLGLQDASYIRLQNLSLGFTMPDQVTKSAGLSNMRMYLTGSNLVTITKFKSYSPEKNPNEYPEAVSFVFGLQVGF